MATVKTVQVAITDSTPDEVSILVLQRPIAYPPDNKTPGKKHFKVLWMVSATPNAGKTLWTGDVRIPDPDKKKIVVIRVIAHNKGGKVLATATKAYRH